MRYNKLEKGSISAYKKISDYQEQSRGNLMESFRNDRKNCMGRGHAGVTSVREIRAEERASRLQLMRDEGTHTHTYSTGLGVCEAFNVSDLRRGRLISNLSISRCPAAVTSFYFSIRLTAG